MQLTMETLDLALRIAAAILLGAAIGLERQWRSRMAGIRTNALVSGGSALFVVLGAYGFDGVTADPTRVAAQVVSGIGFLGAGVILREGLNIRGLNTAATLWCAAAIGSLAGAGLYILAIVGAAFIIGANTVMRPVSRLVNSRRRSPDGESAEDDDGPLQPIEYMLEAKTNDKSEQRVRASSCRRSAARSSPSAHSAPRAARTRAWSSMPTCSPARTRMRGARTCRSAHQPRPQGHVGALVGGGRRR